jgi:hypothetical protein
MLSSVAQVGFPRNMLFQVRFAEFVIETKSEFIEFSQPRTASRTIGHLEIDNYTKKFSNLE